MAKCIRIYNDSSSELVKSESGNWFYRIYDYNVYTSCYCWSKWKELGKLKTVKRSNCVYENLNGNEIHEYRLELEFEKTFNKFYFKLKNKRNCNGIRYRLPY